MDPNEGYLLISEVSRTHVIPEDLSGIHKLGVYYHNHYDWSNDTIPSSKHVNYGIYLVADQCLFRHPDGGELSAFLQVAWSPASRNTNCNYLGFGLNYQGLIAGRTNDALGLALARAGFRNSVSSNESTLELTYKLQMNGHLFIQPDLQYVIHPAGTGVLPDNAFVGILRVGIEI